MPSDDDRVRCPRCHDEHRVGDREAVDGGRECPECGERTAEVLGEVDLLMEADDGV